MAKNIRSEYVKNLLAEKDNLGAMLSESTSEAIKSYLGESVNKGIRNILSEAEDSFTEEEVDDAKPKLKKDSKKDTKKSKTGKKDSKEDKKKNKFFNDDEEDEKSMDDETNDFDEEEPEEGDDFDIEDDDFNSEDDTDFDNDEDDFDEEEPEESDDFEDDDFEADDDFDGENMESGDDNGSDEEVWDSVEQFMGEDGEYDLTGQDKDTVIKVLKVMKPEDGVRIVQKDNGMYELNDENNDVEYIIDLNGNEDMSFNEMNERRLYEMDGEMDDEFQDIDYNDGFDTEGMYEEPEEEMPDTFSDDEEADFNYGDEDTDFDGEETEFDVEMGSDNTDFDDDMDSEDDFEPDGFDSEDDFDYEEPMDGECCMNEDLGYDSHYGQNKTAITMDSDDGAGSGFDAGVPKGSKNNGQRWVGNTSGKMAPYSKKAGSEKIFEVELEEEELVDNVPASNDTFTTEPPYQSTSEDMGGARVHRTKAHPANDAAKKRFSRSNVNKTSNENFERKVKAIMAENKELKKIANEIKQRLEENVVVNASLGKIIKLMVENTTSKDEKVSILNRFNKVKSVKESKALYESISAELKNSRKSPMLGKQITEAKKTKQQIVENRLNDSPDVSGMQSLINRLDNLSKKR